MSVLHVRDSKVESVKEGKRMYPESMKPHGLALMDYFNGDHSAKITIRRDDGQTDDLSMSVFFRKASDFSLIEQTALNLCHGHILDVGAGAGPHSLVLQKMGFSVCAIDISSEACEIMQERGVKDIHCTDIYNFSGETFDTILMLCHGIGLLENISGLDRFLEYAHQLVKPDGQIIFDSLDVRYTDNPQHLAYQEANRKVNRYFGEFQLRIEYKGQKWPVWGWLHVDSETLTEHALKKGWSCEVILQEEDGNYLGRLSPLD
jgi:2-polyprenyl-3-methyl-5-hydroxy-6-metoxy-1,4-benzoquinol methylase